MLNRVLSKPSNLRFITLISSSSQSQYQYSHPPLIQNLSYFSRYFSSTNGNGGGKSSSSDFWKISSENEEESIESVFGANDIDEAFTPIETQEIGSKESVGAAAAEVGFKDWNFVKDKNDDDGVFDIVSNMAGIDIGDNDDACSNIETDNTQKKQQEEEEDRLLEIEEKAFSQVLLKDSDHVFGDLIAASGITDEMLDSLMTLKDLDDVPGLPPLSTIEDMRYEKNTRKSTRSDIERQKQEEIAASRVRQVDSLGRAYGTGKRKCSIARVWIEPGEGKFVVNDKQFDVYFPMLDQRAAFLRPLSETKTLGLLDVNCTVKGGGMSGQIGAIRLGMSRALQKWAPDQFRPPLKKAGFLTRDSRVVERKKPGKAKARKSFQWVKR